MSPSSDPSLPILASTLYAREPTTTTEPAGPAGGGGWRTGVESLDRVSRGVLGCAGVVGLCGCGSVLHARSRLLMHTTAATHLLDGHDTASRPHDNSAPAVFIIEPPTTPSDETSLLQIYNLLSTSLQTQRTSTKTGSTSKVNIDTELESLVSHISILPYFDLIGVSQALTEISDVLHNQTHAKPQLNPTTKTLVLLRGLGDVLSSSTARQTSTSGSASTAAQPFALLTEVLRQVRRLARLQTPTHNRTERGAGSEDVGGVMVLVELGSPQETSAQTESGASEHDPLVLDSAFLSPRGRVMRSNLATNEGTVGGIGKRTLEDGLALLLSDMVDGVVVVHDGFGVVRPERESHDQGRGTAGVTRGDPTGCVVEVVKDRLDGASGTWAVWNTEGQELG